MVFGATGQLRYGMICQKCKFLKNKKYRIFTVFWANSTKKRLKHVKNESKYG